MHLEIIKITYNKTAKHFMDDRFVNLGEYGVPFVPKMGRLLRTIQLSLSTVIAYLFR